MTRTDGHETAQERPESLQLIVEGGIGIVAPPEAAAYSITTASHRLLGALLRSLLASSLILSGSSAQ
jgi:hypothetical protein